MKQNTPRKHQDRSGRKKGEPANSFTHWSDSVAREACTCVTASNEPYTGHSFDCAIAKQSIAMGWFRPKDWVHVAPGTWELRRPKH